MPERDSAGQRDRLIAIEQCVDTVGPSQFPLETWTTLAPTVWAARDDDSGDEPFRADQVSGVAGVTWTIPYRADCDPEVVDVVKQRRLTCQGRVYDIVSAEQVSYRRALVLRTRVKVG